MKRPTQERVGKGGSSLALAGKPAARLAALSDETATLSRTFWAICLGRAVARKANRAIWIAPMRRKMGWTRWRERPETRPAEREPSARDKVEGRTVSLS